MIEIRGEAWLLPTGGIEAGAHWGRGRSVEGFPPPDQSALERAES